MWLIYGSSLDREAFTHWAGEHGYRVPDFAGARPARLDGFRLAFDVQSRFWGGAVASFGRRPASRSRGWRCRWRATRAGSSITKRARSAGITMFPVELVVTDGGDRIAAVTYRAAKPLDRELRRRARSSNAGQGCARLAAWRGVNRSVVAASLESLGRSRNRIQSAAGSAVKSATIDSTKASAASRRTDASAAASATPKARKPPALMSVAKKIARPAMRSV